MSGVRNGAESADGRETVLSGECVAYSVRESARASRPRIDVRPAGVTVVVPETDRSRVDPDAVLAGHAEWVLEKRAAMAARRERAPDRAYGPGATWPVLGAEREIVVERRRSSTVDRDADLIRLARSHVDRTAHKRALEYCFRETARAEFERRVDALAPEMGVADAVGGVEVRNQRTRWGSCSSNGTLSLNWRLLLAPPAVLRYVVVHELAHLRKRDHSDAFWRIVAAHDTEWERHRDWLREHADELIFDESDL
ncbi:SprT family zinc-dependent metalloprotease [Haloparvum alkalitolerans]|uniref:M48 family metallopeptidase n=1 Tax=Haloparvum alkalitolerans TaxID=1042953 RepID=UPI003CF2B654